MAKRKFKRDYIMLEAKDLNFRFKDKVTPKAFAKIEITDEKLLKDTGGIVQGMSGSPIIQDDYIIGAVTHVVVDDPSKGYGIFITKMLIIRYNPKILFKNFSI